MATVTQLATRITAATPAAVAAAIGGGTTANEVAALVKLLTVMGLRPGDGIPLLSIAMQSGSTIDTNLTFA